MKKLEVSNFQLQTIAWSSVQKNELIGSGGFGEVYKGVWHGTPVAIKTLYLKALKNDLKEAFQQEATLLASCQFENIVRLYGVCLEPGHYAMVMEYLPKGSLYDVLHDSKEDLPWLPIRWQIAIDIGRGLSYLHDKQIIHRDLKSLNVLIDGQYHAKITDFGLARIKVETNTTTTQNNKAIGSTRWMAPELFKRKATHSFESDTYSYGVILWEIATRKLPFADAANEVTVVSWLQGGEQEEIPADSPKEYAAVIQQCWAPDAKARLTASDATKLLQTALANLQPAVVEKSWHFAADTKLTAVDNNNNASSVYSLLPASTKDVEKVLQHYRHHPVSGMDIKSVQVIFNKTLNRAFELRLSTLQQRQGKAAFAPKWQEENESGWRTKIHALLESLSTAYTDADYPAVKLLPLWHGTNSNILKSLFETGYANLAATDSGYFGKGIYSSFEAEYAHRVYSKGALILNWVSTFSAYPTIDGDMEKLKEKGNYQNYDAHFIPVIPPNGSFSNQATVYYPCKPSQQHQYIEMVVFDAQQCLPRYLVELQPSLPKSPSALPPVPPRPTALPPVPLRQISARPVPAAPSKIAGEIEFEQGEVLFLQAKYLQALPYLEQAAAKGYPAAYLRLGWLYFEGGRVGPKDEQKSKANYDKAALSIDWFKQQAQTGKAAAQRYLGWCYDNGIGLVQDEKEAVKWYQKAAEQGFVDAQNILGICYLEGMGVTKNEKEAIKWYQKAAEQGFTLAQCNFGACYDNGIAVTKNQKEAVKWFQKAAEQGEAKAQYYLGGCYKYGSGITKDYKQAVRWYQKAAEQGYAEAQNSLGECYENGIGVTQDDKQAVYWYQQAAAQGYAGAQLNLGLCFHYGVGLVQDGKQAFYWYQKAAEQGEVLAKFNLGLCYVTGTGVVQDYKQAVYWYEQAAEQGYASAQNNLAGFYADGVVVAQSHEQAAYWYQQAAEQGNAMAQHNLGMCYLNGSGIGQDEQQAVYWFQQAAEQGNVSGQTSLGTCYFHGIGVNRDGNQAVYWFQKAVNQGEARAQYNLGLCYEDGFGVAQNNKQAVYWYQKSAEQGFAEAQNNLGGCYASGNGVAQDYKLAVKWFQNAANQEFAGAQINLGRCYEKGYGVAKDYKQAYYWYRKAAEQGDDVAQKNLDALIKQNPSLLKLGSNPNILLAPPNNRSNNSNNNSNDDKPKKGFSLFGLGKK